MPYVTTLGSAPASTASARTVTSPSTHPELTAPTTAPPYHSREECPRRSRRVSRGRRRVPELASRRAVVSNKPLKFKRVHHWGRLILRVLIATAVIGGSVGGVILLRALTPDDQIRLQVL